MTMFALPEAKRVRREDAFGQSALSDESEGEASQAEALRASLRARLAASLGLEAEFLSYGEATGGETNVAGSASSRPSPAAAAAAAGRGVEGGGGKDEHGFAFRLFKTSGEVPRVVLEEDDAAAAVWQGEGGLVARRRPQSCFLVLELSPEQREQYRIAAVAGDDVLQRSRQRSWGLEMPWRVTAAATCRGTLEVTSGAAAGRGHGESVGQQEVAGHAPLRRRRPGKKRRILLRSRERARTEKLASTDRQHREKEEHMRDKKKRLNRLKKLRRRAKGKDKKFATHQQGEEKESVEE